jgi:hypothetical protein
MASLLTRVLRSNKGRSQRPRFFVCIAAVLATLNCSRSRHDKGADAGTRLGANAPSPQPDTALQSSDRESTGGPFEKGANRAALGSAGAAGSARPAAGTTDTSFPADAGMLSLKLDKSFDLGPSGAVVATPTGAVFRTRGDELVAFVLSPSSTAPKRIGRSAEAEAGEEGLGSRGPTPAFTRAGYAYWVTRGRVVRRAVSAGSGAAAPLEVLAEGALDGSRVAAETAAIGGTGQRREVAIYIAREEKKGDERGARIWVEGAGSAALSSEGSGASSVALAAAGAGLIAVMLDSRAAMSPVHARAVDLRESGAARLGPDVVVFIGPSPEGHSDVVAAPSSEGPVAFIPFPPDTSSFGLALLAIGNEPHLDARVQWRMYPNGLEPAPVAAALFCGRTWVAYVRPLASTPASPHVLALAPVEKGAFGPELSVAQGFDFSAVSLAPRDDGGAWLSWVFNGRSFVRGVRCP